MHGINDGGLAAGVLDHAKESFVFHRSLAALNTIHHGFADIECVVITRRRIAQIRMRVAGEIVNDREIGGRHQIVPAIDRFAGEFLHLLKHRQTRALVAVGTDGCITPAIAVMKHKPRDRLAAL